MLSPTEVTRSSLPAQVPATYLARNLEAFTRCSGLLVIVMGTVAIGGSLLGIPLLRSLLPGHVTMKANTAICLVLLGIAFLIVDSKQPISALGRRLAAVLALIVATLGIVSLGECLYGWDFGIDQLLFPESAREAIGSVRPGLMSPITAADFVLLAIALILLDGGPRRFCISQALAFVSALVVAFGVFDFVLSSDPGHTHIALPTSCALFLLSCAVGCSRKDRGLAALLASPGLGGSVIRGLLPVSLLVPAFIGYMRWRGSQQGLYSEWFGAALMSVSAIALLAGMSAWTGFVIERTDRERRVAETELRAQAALINLAHDAIVVRDLESRVVLWSRGAEDTYGWSAGEAKGRIIHDLLKTEFPVDLKVIETVVQESGSWEGELTHRKRNGERIVVTSRWSLQRDEAGRPKAMLEINRDITDRKRAEQAVQAERQRFRDVLDRLPTYVCLLTPDYHASFANRVFRERFGEGQPGQRCFELLFSRSEPCEVCETYKVLKTGLPLQWKWTGPDGRHYDVFDFPFKDTDGASLILEMGLDVTDRENAEKLCSRAKKHSECWRTLCHKWCGYAPRTDSTCTSINAGWSTPG